MNRDLVARYFEMWNTGDTSIADEVLAPQWVDHNHPEIRGVDDVKQAVRAIRSARPTLRFRVDAILTGPAAPDAAGGDLCAVVGGVGGSHLLWLIRVHDDRLTEMWTYTRAG